MPDRKTSFVLDVISLIKSKHAVLNKRSSSLKPKSVTFKEEESEEYLQRGKEKQGNSGHLGGKNGGLDMYATLDVQKAGGFK
jgi:hypothetical protein